MSINTIIRSTAVLAYVTTLVAQQTGPDPNGWRRFGDRTGDYNTSETAPAADPPQNYPAQNSTTPNYPIQNQVAQLPSQMTIRPGTYITIRINQELSSDHSMPGQAFDATLVKPIVVSGIVVARHGQTVSGRVIEAKKAGQVKGTSHLAIQLTELSLVDGQQVPIQCQLLSAQGDTSKGRDAGAIGATVATGAAIGAMADGGFGAGIGAAAGLVASTIGVLLTRGHPTVIGPEQVLTFRIDAPVTFSTEGGSEAFRWVTPGDYERTAQEVSLQPRPAPVPVAGYPYPYAYPWYGGYWGGYYPYWGWGPAFSFYYGPRYHGGYYYHGGYHGGGYHGGGYHGGGHH